MNVLLQVSDTHFGTERAQAVEALVRLVGEQRPAIAILSGDITQRARRGQFDAARRFAARLGAPVTLAIPGNHDIPLFNVFARLFAPYANYAFAFGDDLEPEYESPELLVVCVNTTRPRRHVQGEVSPGQIARVAERLRAARPEQLRLVVVHHPVHVICVEDERNVLRGHLEALRDWASAGADLVLGGHIHLPYVRPIPGLARPLWTVQAGTAVSRRVRKGGANSVNIVRYDASTRPRACVVERWDLRGAGFALAESTRILLAR